MNYTLEVTVDPTHTKENPAEGAIMIARGIIVDTSIYPQTYLGGTIKAVVKLEGTQIYPTISGEHYTLIEKPIEIKDRYPLFPMENDLRMVCWAEGAFYGHRIILKTTVLPLTRDMRKVTY